MIKGVSELGICGVAAAIANAIDDATGVRVRDGSGAHTTMGRRIGCWDGSGSRCEGADDE